MNKTTGASLLACALLLAGCGGEDGKGASTANLQAPLTQIPAPNNGNWAEVATRTPEGGTRIGNPDAPVKLVEYGSLTCPACKAFSDTGTEALRDRYVRSGQVSWEFRHFIIHGAPDVALALLSDCQPPTAFFRTIENIYDEQSEILDRIDEQEQQSFQSLPPEQLLVPVARAMELNTFFAQRGLPEARFNQCLGNQQAVQRLADNSNRARTQDRVEGTPTFIVNGEKINVVSWADLEPVLRQRIGN